MRIAIREQLGVLVLFCSLASITVIAVASWVVNNNYVLSVTKDSLALTASLYAQQLLSSLTVLQAGVESISTRVLIQQALGRYYAGNTTYANWVRSQSDLQIGLQGGGSAQWLLQAQVQGFNDTGTGNNTLLRATGQSVLDQNIVLPYQINGSKVMLGQDVGGYPAGLYPNFTYTTTTINSTYNQSTTFWNGEPLFHNSTIFLGPWSLNDTYALMSITTPIINSTSPSQLLGWITVIANSFLIQEVTQSVNGLGNTGVILLVGPADQNNTFGSGIIFDDKRTAPDPYYNEPMRFVLPPGQNASRSTRHASFAGSGSVNSFNHTFPLGTYPAVEAALTQKNSGSLNSGSLLDTRNEEGDRVSVGFAFPQPTLVDWVLLVEQQHSEVTAPLAYLRNVLLACVFGAVAFVIILAFPTAHYAVRPIRRLREATTKSVEGSAGTSDMGSTHTRMSLPFVEPMNEKANRKPLWKRVWAKIRRPSWQEKHSRRGSFRIPKKVELQKHIIKDELTDLTTMFNEMVDELNLQYIRLEEKVRERTAELELSKKAAEAANEAKTLFIANISHELKTPLNGILGMCAVTMHEVDMTKIKRSLGIIHKSGDLLLHLLTDLLTFSKNQVGQHVKLEEKEFRLADISSQVLAIFEQQAREGLIDFRLDFEGPDEDVLASDAVGAPIYGPHGTNKISDMSLWGDQHRVLQVIINLVSNSLKFTPKGGSVRVRIKCLGAVNMDGNDQPPSRKASQQSRTGRFLRRGKTQESRTSSNSGSFASFEKLHSIATGSNMSTAIEINSVDPPADRRPRPKKLGSSDINVRDVSPSPTRAIRTLLFEFSVEDTGPGIHPDQQEKIFEPFVQGDLGLSKKYGGTGLGLSICQQLAKLMKGNVTLESELGKGSKFVMTIPLRFVKSMADTLASSKVDGSKRHSLQINKGVQDDMTPPNVGSPERDSSNSRPQSTRGLQTAVGAAAIVADSMTPVDNPDHDTSDSELSTHSAPAGAAYRATLSPARNTRLVGLSQPYFATSPPLEVESSRIEAMQRVAAEAQESGRKVRVLVAEDNKVNQEVVLRMLKLEDIYDVTIACDGQQAFDFVKASLEKSPPEYYDLIFMDVQMPNVDGLQSTRLIRGVGYSAPIVALTAFAEESNMQECMESGMDWFLPKPIRRPALRQVLKKFCPTIPEEDEDPNGQKVDGKVVGLGPDKATIVSKGKKKSSSNSKKVEEGSEGVDLRQRRLSASAGKSKGREVTEVLLDGGPVVTRGSVEQQRI